MGDGERQRDLGVDLLRGYLMFVVVIDHVGSFPSVFELFTGRGQLWASAAEGFVLVSGYLVGRLRGPLVVRGDLHGATRKLVRRAGTLALWSMLLTLLFTALARVSGFAPPMGGAPDLGQPEVTLWRAITLQYTYGLHDMLPMYAACLLVSPIVLWALARGWGAAVALASLALWTIGTVTPEPLWRAGYFSIACWQLMFFAGVLLGFYADRLRAAWERVPEQWRTRLLVAATVMTVVTVAASYWRLPPPSTSLSFSVYGENNMRAHPVLFSKIRLGPGRIFCAVLWLFALYGLMKQFEPLAVKRLGWLLLPLGQHSLYVYIVQAVLLFPISARNTQNVFLASAAGMLAVLSVWVLVRRRVLFRLIPT
jgi:hypothetical protein